VNIGKANIGIGVVIEKALSAGERFRASTTGSEVYHIIDDPRRGHGPDITNMTRRPADLQTVKS